MGANRNGIPHPLPAENASDDSGPSKNNGCKPKRKRSRKPFDEAISPNAERVDDIRSHDIIFGRGKGYQNHPGNKRMRTIVCQYKAQFKALDRLRKRDLVEAVYSLMTQHGARFLHKLETEDSFVIVDIPIALQKVRNAFRFKKGLGRETGEHDNVVLSTAASTFERKTSRPLFGSNHQSEEGAASAGLGVGGDAAALRQSLETEMASSRIATPPSHGGLAPPPIALRHTLAVQQELMARQASRFNSIVGNDLLSRAYAGMASLHGLDFLPPLTHFGEWGLLAGRSLGVSSTQIRSTPLLPRADYRELPLSLLQERQAQLGGGIGTSASLPKTNDMI
eukprot:CAMPEP_0113656982 /NCGR_PEP_ID=MMETSP0017_2-20120614/30757_1 /TAXON_ID=2856 /ORGANISM="Cylindrotheca closterium" /LENGTH=336 /DNA_ID=CAMNT_0000570787 /DNA_START=588 /DNA_END=1599 /DNA_ORIENTATION=- /assembly_acc=CAM_ASM_000147